MSIAPETFATVEVTTTRPLALFWERLRSDKIALAAFTFLVIVVLAAVFAGPITRLVAHPPNAQYTDRLDPVFGTPTGPSRDFLFGVDTVGSDVFARVLYGARVSLVVAIVGTGIAMLIGTTLGIVAGYYRGIVDTVISRTVDVMLAFPLLLLALGIASACSLGQGCVGGVIQPGMSTVIGIIVLFSWTYFARLARGQVLSLREKEFVEAARATGASDLAILGREILPNIVTPVLVYLTLVIPLNILLEAALSYLGVGINPPQASWGQMIAEATPLFDSAWWYFLFPGVALVLTVLAFNLLGEAVRDALDPHMSKP
ncbi:MAG: ABC transporter permease [Actinobacteria bacterium RBG_16_68_12]|nr:MAG: ABC transporter permease [Actinobacteria bacterium RBG_16_68_12]